MNHNDSSAFAASETLAAQELKRRLSAATAKAAIAIHTESDATALHTERMAWVRESLRNPATMAQRMCLGVLVTLNPADEAAVEELSDAQIDGAVASLINAYAL
jgi:uncharacterized membrane protein